MAAFNEAVTRLNSPDVVSRGIAADLLADQEQPGALQEVLGRVQQVQDLIFFRYFRLFRLFRFFRF